MVTIRDGEVVQVPDEHDPEDNPDTAYDSLDETWRKAANRADRFWLSPATADFVSPEERARQFRLAFATKGVVR